MTTDQPHCLVVTHTHERIARTLLGVARQSLPAASITVAADCDDERISDEVARAADMTGTRMRLVLRPRCPDSRRSQNRNNAVRALLDSGISDSSVLIFYDGDCIPDQGCNAAHLHALQRCDVSLGWAVRLTPEQTARLDDAQVLNGQISEHMTSAQQQDKRGVHRRTRKRIFLRRFGLTKPHKPGILSGNFALRLERYKQVNGFDESFTGWGAEDDDIARRLYMIGSKPGSSMLDAVVFHQYHTSEAPTEWGAAPNADRLSKPVTAVSTLGLNNPASQPDPVVRVFG